MRTSSLRRAAAALAAVTSLALAAGACSGTTKKDVGKEDATAASAAAGGTADPDAALRKGLTVGFLPKQVNNPYFTTAGKGGEQALRELGSTYKEVGPSSATDTAGQVSYVNTLTQQRVDAMAVSAQDPGALCTALTQAMKNGVKVVTYDSDTKPECRHAFVSQASAENLGRTQVRLLAEQIGYRGKIAVLSAAQTATNQNTWITYMKDELKDPKYKDVKLVKVAYGNDDAQQSFQQTQGLLQEFPDLKGIVSPTTVGIKAAAQYLSGSRYKGKVRLTGLGTPNDLRSYVKNGTIEAFELWDPAKLGALAAHTAVALASGRVTGAPGETLDAGELGEYTIGENGVIDLGEPTVFDAGNVDRYDF
ncbi:rhamnose ABC transporter substrate-binding protein [Streptomyces tagetis]|uniref:Rhamnose ABC transporter substrate-binding protein n=1 Tax=Streptomyces tagetis TaxID=2820809 RepID=A0A941B6C7_9ACTN|nr:rhamnose ABC transporter substrate-binding protein [Streptomyces sp. RG38]MBQ0826243.1 rhamnose ABC transporter substrate-binding protein [Streptomyces sp. RG38]